MAAARGVKYCSRKGNGRACGESSVSRSSSERDDFVAIGDEVSDAGVALVLVDERQPGFVDCVFDAERTGTVVTNDRLVTDRLVQLVVVAIFVDELWNPLGAAPVEDDRDLVTVGFGELFGGFEPVCQPPIIGVRFVTRQNEDCCFYHTRLSFPDYLIPTAV